MVTEYDSKAFHTNLHGNNYLSVLFQAYCQEENEEEMLALKQVCRNSILNGKNTCFILSVGLESHLVKTDVETKTQQQKQKHSFLIRKLCCILNGEHR